MKIVGGFTFLLLSTALYSQSNLSLGYWGNAAFQPGVKVGMIWPLKAIGSEERKDQLLIHPQLGFYSYPQVSQNYLTQAEALYHRQGSGKRSFQRLGVGIGALVRSRITSVSVSLGSGEIVAKERTASTFFYPNMSYTYGWIVSNRISTYSKLSFDYLIHSTEESSSTIGLEFGINYQLRNRNE